MARISHVEGFVGCTQMTETKPAKPPSALRRWAPLALLVVAAGGFIASGAHKALSLESIALNKAALEAYVDAHQVAGALLYMTIYIIVVALSLPGALIMTLMGGLLFGLWLGTALTVVGATIGATVLFLVARSSVGEALRIKGGAAVTRMSKGLNEDAAAYLLFLRLVPAFPFALVNLAAAVVGTKLSTFVWTTLIGILPGSFAFTLAATGFDGVLDQQRMLFEACRAAGEPDCRIALDLSSLISKPLLLAFAALGLVALIPVMAKRVLRRNMPASSE
jgi:uncharacterized membrane protein YdjX (TVP38/TMEM64 family)